MRIQLATESRRGGQGTFLSDPLFMFVEARSQRALRFTCINTVTRVSRKGTPEPLAECLMVNGSGYPMPLFWTHGEQALLYFLGQLNALHDAVKFTIHITILYR